MFIRYLTLIVCFCFNLQSAENWSPDYLLIGAQKAGTTAVFEFINQHPKVLNKASEVHFFDIHFQKGEGWYKSKFPIKPDSSFVMGDKSPYYLFHPNAAKLAYGYYPHIKIIIVLRDPVERAYSHYQHNMRSGEENRTFEKCIEQEDSIIPILTKKLIENPSIERPGHRRKSYLARGRYAEQIENWLQYYDFSQMLILDADDLRSNPQQSMDLVFGFLGLHPFQVQVKSKESRSSYPPMKSETRAKLKNYFISYNHDLEALLNRLFNWTLSK